MEIKRYPKISIELIQNPKRMYAIPLLGITAKIIMLIPIFFLFIGIGIASIYYSFVNAYVVLTKGVYWDPAYKFFMGVLRFTAKVYFYFAGLTDKYPGFHFKIEDTFTIEIEKPKHPSKFFAIPIIGILARIVLILPFALYEGVMQNASNIGIFCSALPVLFTGKYPESTFEMTRDYMRLNLAELVYFSGLSDDYPSFYISMNHALIKTILIILGLLLSMSDVKDRVSEKNDQRLKQLQNEHPFSTTSLPSYFV